jgi:hypothetical protein
MTQDSPDISERVEAELNQLTQGRSISAEIAKDVCDRVRDVCRPKGKGDLESSDSMVRQVGEEWCASAFRFFVEKNWILPAENLFVDLWDDLGERQTKSRKHVHRASIAQLLTEVTYRAGRTAKAFRWSLLTQADDVLGKSEGRGVYSKHWLAGVFGVKATEKRTLDDIAGECLRIAQKDGWHSPAGFAEEVLRQLCSTHPIGDALLARYSGPDEFPISRSYLHVLLTAAHKAKNTADKGTTLEDLASYLFMLPGGCVPRRNVTDGAGASEYDLVVFNWTSGCNVLPSTLGRQFLVESKNWGKRVNASAVGYFLHRMHLTHCTFGVILSKHGVTRRPGSDAFAEALITRSFHEDGASCVVIAQEDIEGLVSGKLTSITHLLVDRLNTLQFGKNKEHGS